MSKRYAGRPRSGRVRCCAASHSAASPASTVTGTQGMFGVHGSRRWEDGGRLAIDVIVTVTEPLVLPAAIFAGFTLQPAPVRLAGVAHAKLLPGVTNVAKVSTAGDINPANDTASDPTIVDPAADLSVAVHAFPSPVAEGRDLTYRIVVTNKGPSAATGVMVRDDLPRGVAVLSIESSQGNCTTLLCNLGALGDSAQATMTIVVRVLPTAGSTLVNTVTVTGNEFDPNLANNKASVTTRVYSWGYR